MVREKRIKYFRFPLSTYLVVFFLSGGFVNVAAGDFTSDVNQAIQAHGQYDQMAMKYSVTFAQRMGDKLKMKYVEDQDVLVHNGRIRLSSVVRDSEGKLLTSSMKVFDGEKTVAYYPGHTTATVDAGKPVTLDASIISLKAIQVGLTPLSRFSIKNQQTSLQDVLDKTSQPKSNDYAYKHLSDIPRIELALYQGGYENGNQVWYATGRMADGVAAKLFVDTNHNWLILRQEFYNELGQLAKVYEAKDVRNFEGKSFPMSWNITSYGYSATGQRVISQVLTVNQKEVTFSVSASASDFKLDLPQGTYIRDRIIDSTYVKGNELNINESFGENIINGSIQSLASIRPEDKKVTAKQVLEHATEKPNPQKTIEQPQKLQQSQTFQHVESSRKYWWVIVVFLIGLTCVGAILILKKVGMRHG